ncbi:UDP-N-acetylglucosamine--peptide N-acetylglucosaminyltransferase 110 kDa subunit [Durusdinium trenchii]|uniref:UDP-N-acetylglucosamine--peptide N-acetylglucosaminyltransferase 110 kDa subunit n=1 Tax=Durusdinium trenchii TaxID=1381693 RepID=A0ABP0JZE7_9DINO
MEGPPVSHCETSWWGGTGTAAKHQPPMGHSRFSWGLVEPAARDKALGLNKLAGVMQRNKQVGKAAKLYEAALQHDPCCVFALHNLGSLLAGLGLLRRAQQLLQRGCVVAPDFLPMAQALAATKLRAGSDLEDVVALCQHVLQADPDAYDTFANLTTALRRLGRSDEAIRRAWAQLCDERPALWPLPRTETHAQHNPTLAVVCVKWGTKYDSAYVTRLHRAVQRHLRKIALEFYCFTEDPDGLDSQPGITVCPLPEDDRWQGWWNKALVLFSGYLERHVSVACTRVLYIDLDTVIVGALDDLALYRGSFGILGTSSFQSTEDRMGGYNSSLMLFPLLRQEQAHLRQVHRLLEDIGLDRVKRVVPRLDFWLEMTVPGADVLQELFPGQLIDYKTHVRDEGNGKLPEGARVVNFPLRPKPHQCTSQDWIQQHWLN